MGLEATGGECLIPEPRVPFANVRSRVAHTGASFAVMVAYLLFLLAFTITADRTNGDVVREAQRAADAVTGCDDVAVSRCHASPRRPVGSMEGYRT